MTQLTKNSLLSLKSGPSGRAMAQPMDTALVESFHQHITMERNASVMYFSMSLWFAQRELRGFSSFFSNESIKEQEHAKQFANYLIVRGQKIILEELPAPNVDFENIEEVLAISFQAEADLTSSLNQLYSLSERSSDTRSTVFLDPIVENQISSEDEISYLFGRIKYTQDNPSALLIIDDELNGKGIIPLP